ncbi:MULTISPECIES: STAS domain-containing protein [Lysinibacillus]|uniref:Anti-sigma factor antagonist n=1 Tax=Lysinibacillus antri TaxID=2498145 RepID=A0A3S0P5W7_9BACI|nr:MULTISPECIES: STAS domain-containing protein [Lysinibacillus]RUL47895.1 anti-sigma factor antagonist [Lysinibacillus antri]TSI10700.1 STAS domain-containing protein [Lysinibacillus sp. BW-2-10]
MRKENETIEIVSWDTDVTLKTIHVFEATLNALTNIDNDKIILKFIGVNYMNSAGLGVLVDTVLKVRRTAKQVVLVGVTEALMEIFSIVKITSIIQVFPTLEEAYYYYRNE